MKRSISLILVIFAIFSQSLLLAQNESNFWYFGMNAGLDFSGPTPVGLTNGMVNAQGGSASISDSNGNLLFYTNGMTIWNKNHVPMANGTGLLGHASATQNSIIIPKPGSANIYYVFTNDKSDGTNGLKYSEVDITLSGGLGEVTTNKNISVVDSTAEKLSATMHANESDVWVIAHGRNDDTFYAVLVSALGVSPTPVISNAGTTHSGIAPNNSVLEGQMKVSPDGTKIALATSANGNTFEILDFSNITGIVSNPVSITGIAYETPYGVEFSPDGTKLYCSTTYNNKVYQFNMQAGSPGAIISSGQLVITSMSSNIGGLQLGPDSRVYLARNLSTFLGVINFPNSPGTACNYVDDGVSLTGKKSRRGLPNFIQSYFNNPRFTYLNLCLGDSTFFFISDLNGVVSVNWNFGDPASGPENTSTDLYPYHIFSIPGTFQVQLVRNFSTYSDTVTQAVTIHTLPDIDLGGQVISICEGTDTVLFAGFGFVTYEWNNGSITPSIIGSNPGIYSVTVSDDFGCKNSDSLNITNLLPPDIDLGPDITICEENSLTLNAAYEEGEYNWSTGASTATIEINTAGSYYVTVTNRCGVTTDSINVGIYPTISFELGDDHEICVGDSVIIDPGNLGTSYLWSTGATTQSIIVTTSGTYTLEAYYANTNCYSPSDSVTVTVLDNPTVEASNDTLICEGDMVIVVATGNFIADFNWSNESTTSSFTAGTQGMYYVTASNACGVAADSVYIDVNPVPDIIVGNDTSIYSDETFQLFVTSNPNWFYQWSPDYEITDISIPNPVVSPQTTTTYVVEVIDSLGCRSVGNITISVSERPIPDLIFYNTFSPNGDGVNDFWIIDNVEDFQESILEIYNRNGHKIFSAVNYQNNWDGTYNGKDVPAHTYFYIFKPNKGNKPIETGHITIIR